MGRSESLPSAVAEAVHPDAPFWLPFTPNREFKTGGARLAARAEGIYYWDDQGRRIIDASSGLFCVAAGHGRREIAEAVGRQVAELDYLPPFLRAHGKAFELARRIAELTPGDLNRIFFTNSGSEAVDSAMKIALAYHRARGQGQRQIFISRERAYHGVNFGGIALSGMANNRRHFGIGLAPVAHLRHHHLQENAFTRGQGAQGAELADDLLRLINLHGAENIAAVFVEPVAGSTGVLVPPRGYLQRLREICDQHQLLLVFDEVISGFGRLGDNFGAQTFGVTPDIMTLAKALTNGTVPMGAVAASQRIYDGIVAAAGEQSIEFFHGYTYSAHPLACAAGLAVLDIYRDEGLFERAQKLSPYFLDMVFSLRDLPIVTDIRGIGFLAGFDVAADGAPGVRGHELQKRLWDAGLHLKTTGDAAILAPAYIAEKAHIDEIGDTLRRVLKSF
ncbi:beta-alanine--pyruvate transaminase [Oryzomicrobium terrae]|uniref:Beta-alanine--pyruvate transaminase n=1 Tax=Oryzomicrobium terrae TaxID=1735038 RepID=A0A5C1E8W4_9RHOO|nr:aminotransferase class III-fold pyridoxal phosphate-dependent enzyme [Oryzomicrobium terrae]QEL65059.1 beta-alanine--pyruvate transaminase [Oryzomicrobium terrae]